MRTAGIPGTTFARAGLGSGPAKQFSKHHKRNTTGGQLSQAVKPEEAANDPEMHGLQELLLLLVENRPAEHAEQHVELGAAKKPEEQAKHSVDELALKEPPLQALHA